MSQHEIDMKALDDADALFAAIASVGGRTAVVATHHRLKITNVRRKLTERFGRGKSFEDLFRPFWDGGKPH